jgi:hypothetical protein
VAGHDHRADWRTSILENMARNLSRQPAKELASDFLEAAMEVHRGAVGSMQAAWFRSTQAAEAGVTPDLGHRFQEHGSPSASGNWWRRSTGARFDLG